MRRSQTTKTAMVTAAPASAPIITGDDQPRPGASMIPQSNNPSPRMDNPAPTGSGRVEEEFFELGTNQIAAISPTRATGTLTKKTEPHQKWANRNPPKIGPRATPSPVVPDQIPMARTRSSSAVKTLG